MTSFPHVTVKFDITISDEVTRALRRCVYQMAALLDGDTAAESEVTADNMMLCEEIISQVTLDQVWRHVADVEAEIAAY